VDAIEYVWMTLSRLGKRSQLALLRLGFVPRLTALGFPQKKKCNIVHRAYLHTIYHFLNVWACENGWMR